MRWLNFFILIYVTLGIQIGLGGYSNIGQAQPNFVLLVGVFVAMNAPRDAALLGCFLLGFVQDLLTTSPLGLYALETSLVGLLVVSTQEIVYREHFLTHMFLGFVGALLAAIITLIHSGIYPYFHAGVRSPRPTVGGLIGGALYTGLLAPIVIGILQRLRKLFGFRPGRSHGNRRSL